jgi:hypothetical protein
MYQEISDEMFVKEMRILWQNGPDDNRKLILQCVYDYFEEPRAERIINKMQETI